MPVINSQPLAAPPHPQTSQRNSANTFSALPATSLPFVSAKLSSMLMVIACVGVKALSAALSSKHGASLRKKGATLVCTPRSMERHRLEASMRLRSFRRQETSAEGVAALRSSLWSNKEELKSVEHKVSREQQTTTYFNDTRQLTFHASSPSLIVTFPSGW